MNSDGQVVATVFAERAGEEGIAYGIPSPIVEEAVAEAEEQVSSAATGGLVFANEVGGIVNPSNLRNRSLKTLLERAGLPPTTRFHDLRHTCATLLLSRNVHPKIVQEMLGQSTVAITLDTYSHVLPGLGDQAATAMEDALLQ